jgi:hypothetical protein
MPPNNAFALFVLQQPNGPFGVSWYQGDIDTDRYGRGQVQVRGIFSEETFAFAPGSVAAPQVGGRPGRREEPDLRPCAYLSCWGVVLGAKASPGRGLLEHRHPVRRRPPGGHPGLAPATTLP